HGHITMVDLGQHSYGSSPWPASRWAGQS
ncbi:hypothetical protein CISIN_1g0061312mg, partial [Citrus sinensis]